MLNPSYKIYGLSINSELISDTITERTSFSTYSNIIFNSYLSSLNIPEDTRKLERYSKPTKSL